MSIVSHLINANVILTLHPSVLTISATYQNVLLCGPAHAQWKLAKFRQGVQMVKVRAKILGGAYKSNTEVKFRQAVNDGYD